MTRLHALLASSLTALLLMAALSGCSAADAVDAEPSATDETAAAVSAPDGSEAATEAPTTDKVASAEDTVEAVDVVEEGMEPVEASALVDGTYEVTVDSSSSMFKIVSCELTVADGQMSATMTMSGTGYLYLYLGTAEEAAAAAEADLISFEEDAEGAHTFTVPVAALDEGIDCAAFSKRKEQWYDRTLVFRADSLPDEAFAEGALATVESLGLEDGTYTVEVALSGGSGRASVTSPAQLVVKDGKATATVEWSSKNYDYMVVDGAEYLPVNDEGNSTFEIPVASFDRALAVQADTTAMSTPHLIDYTLTFDSSTIEKA